MLDPPLGSRLPGPSPAKPLQPLCDFDIPESMPVFVSPKLSDCASEEKGDFSTMLQEEADSSSTNSDVGRAEAELQFLTREYRVLQDSAIALTNTVAHELELHRDLVERLLVRQQQRLVEVSKSGHDQASPPVEVQVLRSRSVEAIAEAVNSGGSKSRDAPDVNDAVRLPAVRMAVSDAVSDARAGAVTGVPVTARLISQASRTRSFTNMSEKLPTQKSAGCTGPPSRASSMGANSLAITEPPANFDMHRQAPDLPDVSEVKATDTNTMAMFDTLPVKVEIDGRRSELLKGYKVMKAHEKEQSQMLLGWGGFDDYDDRFEENYVGRNSRFLKMLRQFIASRTFTTGSAILILLNAVFIGVVADVTLRRVIEHFDSRRTPIDLRDVTDDWEVNIDIVFTTVFGLELLMRIAAFQLAFFVGTDWKWNLLDTLIVVIACFDLILQHYELGVSWARLFRLVRLLRSLRVMRVLRFFRQLRLMLISVLSSIMPLIWAVIFLLLVLFVFSVLIADGVAQAFSDALQGFNGDSEDLKYYFGNLPMVLLAHFISVSGGISWWELGLLLNEISWAYVAVFLMYIIVMVLMVLNIITGIFVNDAIEVAQTDRDFAAEALLQKERGVFKELERVFHELDVDGDGYLLFEEFQERVRDPELRAVFCALNLDVSDNPSLATFSPHRQDALRFFRLLDIDNSNAVEIDEFVMGCMHIKGQVGTISIEAMMAENKRMMRQYFRGQKRLEAQVNRAITSMGSIVPNEG